MRKTILLVLALVVTSALAVQTTAASDKSGKDVLEFDTMTGVVAPFTGAANPVRGLGGGGSPWELDRARGRLRSDGRLDIRVKGLVLARRAPVPANLQGTNPITQFRAIVSCLTPAAAGATDPVATVNVPTALVPASSDGDARIDTTVDLPTPCVAPIVFVTSPGNAWFAATGL
jgi:hypothetical protein